MCCMKLSFVGEFLLLMWNSYFFFLKKLINTFKLAHRNEYNDKKLHILVGKSFIHYMYYLYIFIIYDKIQRKEMEKVWLWRLILSKLWIIYQSQENPCKFQDWILWLRKKDKKGLHQFHLVSVHFSNPKPDRNYIEISASSKWKILEAPTIS